MITGQVGIVTRNPGWYGRLVQLFTGSPAYHTVTAISETECVSADVPSVVKVPINTFTDVQWTNVTMTETQRHAAVKFVSDQVGKPYAYGDIILLAVAMILKTHTPRWIADRTTDDRQWFCSELADAGMLVAGINLFGHLPPCTVTPADFYQHITETANNPEGNLVTE